MSLTQQRIREPRNPEVLIKLGLKYQERQDRNKALELFQQARALDPDGKIMMRRENGELVSCGEMAEFQYARTFMVTFGMIEYRRLDEFIKKHPSSRLARDAYLEIMRGYYMDEEGDDFYGRVAAQFPHDPEIANRLAEQVSQFSRNVKQDTNLDRSLTLSENALREAETISLPRTAQNLAQLRFLKGNSDKAEEAYGRDFLAGQVKAWTEILISYAEFWLNRKQNTEDAEAAVRLALSLSPADPGLRRRAAALYLLSPAKPDKALEIYGPEFLKSIQNSPPDLYDYFKFWLTLKANDASAMSALETLLRLKPESVYYRSSAAGVLERAGYKDRALSVFGPDFAAQHSNDTNALYEYADFWIRRNINLDSAVSALETASRISPRSWLRQRQAAELLVKINRPDAALAVFGPSYLPSLGEDASALCEYARFWMVDTKMNKESAMEALEKASRLKSLTMWDRNRAASIFLSVGKPDRAEAIYGAEYLKTIAGDAEALFRYAQFWMYLNKNLNTALEAAQQACQLAKDNHEAWAVLSQLLVIHDRLEDALTAIDNACRLAKSKKTAEKYETSRKQIRAALEKRRK